MQEYPRWQQDAWLQHMAEKLGFSQVQETDQALIEQVLKLLEQGRLDYSLFFRRLSHCTQASDNRNELLTLLQLPECRPTAALEQQLNDWLDTWQQQLTERGDSHSAAQRMQAKNPAVIPRNHRVAEAIAAAESGDYSVFERLLAALEQPYEERQEYADFMQPPQPAEKVLKTFCGT